MHSVLRIKHLNMNKLICVYFAFFSCYTLTTAQKPSEPDKTYLPKELPLFRSADIMWHRRLWREIDLTEEKNKHLYFSKNNPTPNLSLFDIIYERVLNGSLKAYSVKDDRFTTELNPKNLTVLFGDSIFPIDTSQSSTKKFVPLNNKDVVKFWLKEDWIYDKKYSKIEVRILGMCPVKIKKDEFGQVIGYEQLFWVYFPQARYTLVNYEAFKKENDDAPRISFDAVFLERKFSSYIINQNKPTDLQLNENKTELDVKLETEQTKHYFYNEFLKLWN